MLREFFGVPVKSERLTPPQAPQMRNLNRWQWGMTLVQFAADTALTTYSTSWHVWKVSLTFSQPTVPPLTTPQLLGQSVITKTLPVTVSNGKISPLYFVAGDSEHDTTIVKLAVYNSTTPVPVNLKIESVEAGTAATLVTLTGPADPYAINDPFLRTNVVKETTTKLVADKDGAFTFSLPQLSVAVLETEKKGGKGKGKGKGDECKGKGKKAKRVIM